MPNTGDSKLIGIFAFFFCSSFFNWSKKLIFFLLFYFGNVLLTLFNIFWFVFLFLFKQKIFEFDRFDHNQSTQTAANDANTTIITLTQAEYTIVQDHSHKISSSVWKYFGSLKKNDELIDPNHVYCSQCFEDRKTKKYQKSTSTGNLLKHLKKAHHICLDAPQFRVKREKDGIVVTKSEIISGFDNVQYGKLLNL